MLGSELAKAGTPAIVGPNSLVFRFAAMYTQAKEFVTRPDRLARVEEAILRVTEKPWNVRIEIDDSPERLIIPAEATTGPAKPKPMPKEEAEKVPLVRRALDVLGATSHPSDISGG